MIKEKITFGVDRKEVSHTNYIKVWQTINDHHRFEVSVPHSVIEKPRAYTLENAQKWQGGVVHIALENKNNFLGLVEKVSLRKKRDSVGAEIIVTGYSKTILLESGQKLHSWEDTTLQDMIREVIKTAADAQLQNEVQPEFTRPLDYETQYLETDFQFLKRLAKQYHEWLYYDGEKLFFGKPKKQAEKITLMCDQDIYNFNIAVQSKQNKFGSYTYNEDYDKIYKAEVSGKVEGLPRLGDQAFESSQRYFPTASFEHDRIPMGDEGFLEMMLKQQQEVAAADSNYITASSSNNHLKIGSIIEIKIQEEMSPNDAMKFRLDPSQKQYRTSSIGTYIITKIKHKATNIGEYENHFKAIPAFVKRLPKPKVKFPKARLQEAIVIDNADPKKQGRVRVQMLWQKTKHLRGPWVRVMTPDAGTSGEVPKNRGMVFIPEIGDHVMLGFHHHNPNKPLVLGSLFNGTTGAGGQEKNHLKSIFTRGGSTITFNELDNSILIKDPSGNTWFMDGKGNIKVTAPKNMTISVGDNLDITVGKDMSLSVGNDKTSTIGNNNKLDIGNNNSTTIAALYKLVTNMYNEKVNEDKKVDITGNLVETTATTTHKAVGGDILIKSAGVAKVLGAVDAKVNKG